VTRDDLADGGAGHIAAAVEAVKRHNPSITVEVLTPDLRGDREALETVLRSRPDVVNHNLETVSRLYPAVRPQADYRRSLGLLETVKAIDPGTVTKSGLMLGLGEEREEILATMTDLRGASCELLTSAVFAAVEAAPSGGPVLTAGGVCRPGPAGRTDGIPRGLCRAPGAQFLPRRRALRRDPGRQAGNPRG